MRTRLSDRLNNWLDGYLPEQRLFLKSDEGTRFVRLRPTTQAIALTGSALLVGWTVIVTAFFLIGAISSGSSREQTARSQQFYETRLNALSTERDSRAREAQQALERFYVGLEQVSKMQSELLASEERRRELETGIEVIQRTLRRTISERDEAREQAELMLAELETATGSTKTASGRAQEVEATLSFLTDALDATALERDEAAIVAASADAEVGRMREQALVLAEQNAEIFGRLEEAVDVALAPLSKLFSNAGLSTDTLLNEVRRGYSGTGGPLTPIIFSTRGEDEEPHPDMLRANALLRAIEEVDIYRVAAEKAPLAMPVRASVRRTSGFGPRWGRMHNGTDFAGPHGTPIYATADGVVSHAGWSSGFGKLVKIRHAFGFETYYAHQTRIRVSVGQRVSRGDRIGDMGNTGRSTGTHLHYEVRRNGRPVNPMTFINAGRNVF